MTYVLVRSRTVIAADSRGELDIFFGGVTRERERERERGVEREAASYLVQKPLEHPRTLPSNCMMVIGGDTWRMERTWQTLCGRLGAGRVTQGAESSAAVCRLFGLACLTWRNCHCRAIAACRHYKRHSRKKGPSEIDLTICRQVCPLNSLLGNWVTAAIFASSKVEGGDRGVRLKEKKNL